MHFHSLDFSCYPFPDQIFHPPADDAKRASLVLGDKAVVDQADGLANDGNGDDAVEQHHFLSLDHLLLPMLLRRTAQVVR